MLSPLVPFFQKTIQFDGFVALLPSTKLSSHLFPVPLMCFGNAGRLVQWKYTPASLRSSVFLFDLTKAPKCQAGSCSRHTRQPIYRPRVSLPRRCCADQKSACPTKCEDKRMFFFQRLGLQIHR